MHQAYMFLYTPDHDKNLRATADMVAFEYADQHCDCNNWYEVMGIITGDGRSVIDPEFTDHFQDEYGDTLPDINQLTQLALKAMAAKFKLEVPEADDITEYIHRQVPKTLADLYSKAAGNPLFNYDRGIISATYEMFCDCNVKPFTRSVDTPYVYNFYDLRRECWRMDAAIIRPQDAVLFMDIHT